MMDRLFGSTQHVEIRSQPEETIKTDTVVSLQMSEDTNNPVYTLMMDKVQPMLKC